MTRRMTTQKDERIGHALNRWGVAQVTIWQMGERVVGREETERLYPDSRAFFMYMNESR